jgi:predicted PurR-regulated permease PerM
VSTAAVVALERGVASRAVAENDQPQGGAPGAEATGAGTGRGVLLTPDDPSLARGLFSMRGWPDPLAVLRVMLVVVAVVLVLYVIYLLRQPLGWMFISAFIAIAASGPVGMLNRHMRRGPAIAIVYLGIILIPLGMLAVLVPPIVDQAGNLANNAPKYAQDLNDFSQRNKRLQELDNKYDLTTKVQDAAANLPSKIGDAASTLADLGAGFISSLFAGVTILILSIFMVGAGPRWRATFLRAHPPDRADALNRLFDRISAAVGNYVLGALVQALIAGVTSWIVLTLLGVPYPLALALVIFVLDLIPLVGATIGAVLVGIVTLFQDFPTAVIVWAVWSIVYQQIENNVIQPRIQARQVQVEPFFVLASVLFGSALFGIVGALLAIPAAASIQIIVREYLRYRGARLRPAKDAREVELGKGQAPAPARD